jgi:hypothetical protein
MPDQLPHYCDHEALAESIARQLDKRRTVDEKTHAEHHEYVRMCINREKRRDDMIQNVKKHVLGWMAVGLLIGLWQLLVYWFEHWGRGGGHGP